MEMVARLGCVAWWFHRLRAHDTGEIETLPGFLVRKLSCMHMRRMFAKRNRDGRGFAKRMMAGIHVGW